MLIELKIKNDGDDRIFSLDFPQMNEQGMPRKIVLEYNENTNECESFTKYGTLPAIQITCNHKPTKNGWLQIYENSLAEDSKVENETPKIPNLEKDDDVFTILDPEELSGVPHKPPEQFINIDTSDKYCYHPDIPHRIFKRRMKNGTPLVVKIAKIPKWIKQHYYEHIMKTEPPINRTKSPNHPKVFYLDPSENKWMADELAKIEKYVNKHKIKYDRNEVEELMNLIRLELTFNPSYKTEDLHGCIKNKNFKFTEVPDDWDKVTFWERNPKAMMDMVLDEQYIKYKKDVNSTYNVWKNLSFNDMSILQYPDPVKIKAEVISKMIPPPPGIEDFHGTKNLKQHESFFDFLDFKPSVPGPGKVLNDPTNNDINNPVTKMKSFRYYENNDWVELLVFVPHQVEKLDKDSTPVIIYFGTGNNDHFHYYQGNRGRHDYFNHESIDFYNQNCIIISLDYFVKSDKAKRFYINPNENLIKNILTQISARFTNENLRFLMGHSRGAQSALFAHVNNPGFTKRVFTTELYISDNPNTRFDEQRAKYLMDYMPAGSSIIAINGDSNHYRSLDFEQFTTNYENFDIQIIEGYGTMCHQYGILHHFKHDIEYLWIKEMEAKRMQ